MEEKRNSWLKLVLWWHPYETSTFLPSMELCTVASSLNLMGLCTEIPRWLKLFSISRFIFALNLQDFSTASSSILALRSRDFSDLSCLPTFLLFQVGYFFFPIITDSNGRDLFLDQCLRAAYEEGLRRLTPTCPNCPKWALSNFGSFE